MKKVLIILIPIIIVAVVTVILINKSRKPEEDCRPITGGGFNLIFETNSSQKIEDMHVCIACSPSSYADLPQAEKEGATFEGWYYDKKLTKKVEGTNSLDVQPVPQEKNGCRVGYKDITLYAKYK